MRGSRAGRSAPTRRLRWWRLDRNPLRRTVDRVEAVLVGALCAIFVMGAPLVALMAGREAAASSLRLERAEAGWRQVPALLMSTPTAVAQARTEGSIEPQVPARWTAPDGAVQTGRVYAPSPALAQGRELIWVDRQGRLTGVPLGAADVVDRVALAALAACLATAALLAAVGGAVRLAANRRRLAGWDVGWAVAGPQWSGRR